MSRETTDTNSKFNDDIPEGVYDFEVVKVSRRDIKGKVGYEWTLEYKKEGSSYEGRQLLWPNQMGALLKILGCKEVSTGKYEWDTDLMQGKTFKAKVFRQPDKKDLSKVYQMMDSFEASKSEDSVPF